MEKRCESQNRKKIIYSRHIFTNDTSDPIDGYILIENDKFVDIKPRKLVPPDFVNLNPNYEFFDFKDLYIFPGLIDLNVHLNSTYEPDWEDVEGITKMALKGGITTIIDNPILAGYKDVENLPLQIKTHFASLQDNLYTDCGIFGFLSPDNFENLEEATKLGVLGFKGYLSPCLDSKMQYFTKADLKSLRKYLFQTPSDTLFIFHDEMANQRDLHLSSPCRSVDKECRIDKNYKIGNQSEFGGGQAGEVGETRDSGEEEKEEEDGIIEFSSGKSDSRGLELKSPTTTLLRFYAENNSKTEQEQSIAVMEKLQYFENIEESDEIERWVENNSELDLTGVVSDDFSDEELKQQKKNSCPPFKRPSLVTTFSQFKVALNLTMTQLDIPSNNESTNNITSEKEVVSSHELREGEPQNEDRIPSPDQIKCFSKSPTKKRQSQLMMRRKLHGDSITSPMNEIRTVFEKKAEDEEKNTHLYSSTFLSNHSIGFENDGVFFIERTFRRNYKARVLISNVSTAKMAYFIRDKKKNNPKLNIFTDISIPYLFFCSDMVKKGQTKFKNTPPIRKKEDMINSIQSLKKGVFDVVSSYHLQVPPLFKNVDNGNFRRAFSGNSSIGYNLHAIWTRFLSMLKKTYGKNYNSNPKIIEDLFKIIIRVLAVNPAKILGISNIKGEIKNGNHADFMVWDPFVVKKVKRNKICLKYPRLHLFRGLKLYGKVRATFLRGDLVYQRKEFVKKGEVLKKL